jgi:hypothetical protein
MTSKSPCGATPVAVRIETLDPFTVLGSTASENLNLSSWFSAISVTAHPVCEQPRSQLIMQKFSPPLQRIRKDADADDEPPPLQPANISALAKRRIDRALRIVKRECAFDY